MLLRFYMHQHVGLILSLEDCSPQKVQGSITAMKRTMCYPQEMHRHAFPVSYAVVVFKYKIICMQLYSSLWVLVHAAAIYQAQAFIAEFTCRGSCKWTGCIRVDDLYCSFTGTFFTRWGILLCVCVLVTITCSSAVDDKNQETQPLWKTTESRWYFVCISEG